MALRWRFEGIRALGIFNQVTRKRMGGLGDLGIKWKIAYEGSFLARMATLSSWVIGN